MTSIPIVTFIIQIIAGIIIVVVLSELFKVKEYTIVMGIIREQFRKIVAEK